jgi:lysophospholipase L1-like esterase
MKTLIQKHTYIAALLVLVVGCDSDISGSFGEDPDPGSADFSTFVALGDSLTAGYADGALYRHGQENSFPAIMAQQFVSVGGGAFTQPLMPVGATGSLTFTGIGNLGLSDRLVLVPTGNPERPAGPSSIIPTQITSIDVRVGNGGFNNVGVPGAKSFHLVKPPPNGYGELTVAAIGGGSANPYFARFASSDITSMLADAAVQMPTFFVLWIGNNDVLSYATGGGTGVDQNAANNTDPTTYGSSDITDDTVFANVYTGLVATLKTLPETKGILINIPDVSTIPYFTTVPYDAIPMDSALADQANAGFALYNLGVQALVGAPPPCTIDQAEADKRLINFSAGQNPVVILDENLTDLTCFAPQLVNMRQATANDFLVLPTSTKLGEDAGGGLLWGVSAPLLDEDVLIDTEIAAVNTARLAYNATIKAAADADPDLLFFDADALLTELNTTGILYGSGGISSVFAQGGGFSLDGVHPTARGYAVIANEMFKVINAGFGGYIPPVDPSDYSTVFYQ